MFKKILIFFILIAMLGVVVADTVDETSLSALGYSNFNVSENTNLCKIYNFKKLTQIDNSRLFVNLIIENYIPVKRDLVISIYLNNELEKTITAEGLLKENQIELNERLKENNQLKVCINNKVLPSIIVSNKSTIGTYVIGEIKEGEFYQRVLTTDKYKKTLIPIAVYAENNSARPVDVDIIYADPVFLKNSSLETVSGETTYSGKIMPGEVVVLKYYLKTDKTISFATPQAKLIYTTEFGETKTLFAKQNIITVIEKNDKLEVYVDVPKDVIINEIKDGKIIVRNVSETDLKNVTIETSFDNKITLSKRQIPVLKKYAVEEIPFEIVIDEIGTPKLDVTVYYNVGEKENSRTAQSIVISAREKKDYIKEMIGVFLLIAMIVYIWIVRF